MDRFVRQELESTTMKDGSQASAHAQMSRTLLESAQVSSPFWSSVGKSEARLTIHARRWRIRFEGSQTVRHDGLGTRVTDAGGGHVGFGRTVGPSRRRRERPKGDASQRGVGHKKKRLDRKKREKNRRQYCVQNNK